MDILKKYAEEVQTENEPVNAPMFNDIVDNSGNPNPDDEHDDDDPNNPKNKVDEEEGKDKPKDEPKKKPAQGGK